MTMTLDQIRAARTEELLAELCHATDSPEFDWYSKPAMIITPHWVMIVADKQSGCVLA